MDAKSVVIDASMCWEEDEPDGSECIACGDNCYLDMWVLIICCENFAIIKTEHVLCGSCHNALIEVGDADE